MLANVTISVAELANLKPVHCKVLAGLLAFADRFGKCWPSQRTLAAVVGLKLSPLNRAIAEMESAGIFTRTRRGAGTLYQLAERFLWQAIRPKPAEPDCSASGTLSSASGTEGEAKKEIQDLKTKRGSVRLAPPPAASPAEPDVTPFFAENAENEKALPSHVTAALKPSARPVEGPNPFARRQWLRKLNTYIGEHLSGALQWSGWEVVAKAMNGDMLEKTEQRLLDQIDAAMRRCGYSNRSAQGGEP